MTYMNRPIAKSVKDDDDGIRVPWIERTRENGFVLDDAEIREHQRLTNEEKNSGHGFAPDINSSESFRQLPGNGFNLYIQENADTRRMMNSLRKNMPAFTLIPLGNRRLGNKWDIIVPSGAHGQVQAGTGKPLHATFALELITLQALKNGACGSRSEKLKQIQEFRAQRVRGTTYQQRKRTTQYKH